MESFKLIIVSLGFMSVIFGFFFVAFVILKGNKSKSCNSTKSTENSFGCGCGTGRCGMPSDKS